VVFRKSTRRHTGHKPTGWLSDSTEPSPWSFQCSSIDPIRTGMQFLPYAIWFYNTSPHQSTCYYSFFLLCGRAPISPTDQPFTFSPDRNIFHSDHYAHEEIYALSICWEIARQNIAIAQGDQARQHNKRQHVAQIKPDDLVFQYKPATLPSLCPKFTSFWKGPYVVVQVQMPSVQIAIDDTKRSRLEYTHIYMQSG